MDYRDIPLSQWHSFDAAFALGCYSRSPGMDVLYDLTLCESLQLPPRVVSGLHSIIERMERDSQAVEAQASADVQSFDFLHDIQLVETCDAAFAPRSQLQPWYQLGVAFGNLVESIRKRDAASVEDLVAQLLNSIQKVPSGYHSALAPIKKLCTGLKRKRPLSRLLRSLLPDSPPIEDKAATGVLVWDFVLHIGHHIRSVPPPAPPGDSSSVNEERDAYIFHALREGKSDSEIVEYVRNQSGWRKLSSGILEAGLRYAKRHRLDPPPPRRPGRPRKSQ